MCLTLIIALTCFCMQASTKWHVKTTNHFSKVKWNKIIIRRIVFEFKMLEKISVNQTPFHFQSQTTTTTNNNNNKIMRLACTWVLKYLGLIVHYFFFCIILILICHVCVVYLLLQNYIIVWKSSLFLLLCLIERSTYNYLLYYFTLL